MKLKRLALPIAAGSLIVLAIVGVKTFLVLSAFACSAS